MTAPERRSGSAQAAIRSAASSSGRWSPLVATSAAKRCDLHAETVPLGQPAATFDGHVPRHPRGDHTRQARRHHGRHRRDHHLRRARRRGQPAQPAVLRRRAAARATTSPSAWRTTLASSRSSWGCHYAGLYYTACSSRLTDELGLHRQRLRRPGLHHLPVQGRAGGGGRRPRPPVSTRLMLDGASTATSPTRRRPPRQPAEPLPDAVGGVDMLYSSGTTGRPKGVKIARARRAARQRAVQRRRPVPAAVRLDGETVYLSPAPLYHAAPLRFSMADPRGRRHRRRDGALRPRAGAGVHRALPGDPQPVGADDVRAHAEAARRGAGPLRRVALQVAVHAAAPCPVAVKEQMIEWWGPVIHEYYAGTEGNGFVYCNSESGWRTRARSAARSAARSTSSATTARSCPWARPARSTSRAAAVRVPQRPRQDGGVPLGPGLVDARRRRLPRRGRLPLPHRPQGLHDHLRRREHLPAGGGEHPDQAPRRCVDVAVFGVPNEDFGEEVKAVVQPATCRPTPSRGRAGTGADRLLPQHLADVKCPRSVDFRDELPRHPTGKLYKRLLKDEYWAGHQTRII